MPSTRPWPAPADAPHARPSAGPRIAVYADGYDAGVAANRLRLLQPMQWLGERGAAVHRHRPGDDPRDCDLLFVSRAHTSEAVRVAQATRDAGRPVVFDICDNLLAGYRSWHDRRRAPRVMAMLRAASVVTTPTPVLAATLAAEVPGAGAFRVIPDTLETLPPCPSGSAADRALGGLRRFLARHPGALHCVWFGSSTKCLAGLSHLDSAIAELEAFARDRAVTLTIISDTRLRCWISQRWWRLPSFYQPFDIADFGAALALHGVAVIPVQRNPYTIGKSINRPATALMAGLGVVADGIDSYEPLRPYVSLDDWQEGLARYSTTPPAADPRLAAARR